MPATIRHVSETEVVLEVRVPLGRSMLDNERAIQQALNEAGNLATGKVLEAFDADGAPIQVGGVRLTSRGQLPKGKRSRLYGERVRGTSDGDEVPFNTALRAATRTSRTFRPC